MENEVEAYLLTGSNLGDRIANLKEAQHQISVKAGALLAASSIYETEPWGVHDQPWFLNQVLKIKTTLSPHELLSILKKVELETSGEKQRHWGERLLDIDILFYGNAIIDDEKLQIPHPQIARRNFTLIPLAEIAPDEIHPVLNKTVKELKTECVDKLEVKKWRYREA